MIILSILMHKLIFNLKQQTKVEVRSDIDFRGCGIAGFCVLHEACTQRCPAPTGESLC